MEKTLRNKEKIKPQKKKSIFYPLLFSSFLFFFLVLTVSSAGNAVEKELFPGRTYDPKIPTPTEFFGYRIGAFHTTYSPMVLYFRELEKNSNRILFRTYGQSYERRPLYYALISSSRNIERLEDIKKNLWLLAYPEQLVNNNNAENIIGTTPAVVFLNFGTHGNETAAFETAIHDAYQLVAATDRETKDMLEELIVIITPAMNPDSHERFVTWYNANQVGPKGSADPNAAEHFAPWGVDSNDNHYQINLNRESVWSTQVESQALIRLYLEWNPQVFIDHHGQPEEFIGPWYAEPLNTEITANQREWFARFGKDIAQIFQEYNYRYTPWEFGILYPGYWDIFSILNGGIGFTLESGGGGWKGLNLSMQGGHKTSLEEGVIKNMIADQSALRVTAQNREQKLRDFLAYKRSAIEEGKRHPVQAYVFPPANDPQELDNVVNLMTRIGVRVLRARAPFRVSQATPYFRGKEGPYSFPEGSYLLPVSQPQSRLIRVLMSRETKIPQTYLNQVEENLKLSETAGFLNPNIWVTTESFYDVTAWSLPFTNNLEAYTISQVPKVEMEPIQTEIHTPGNFLNSKATFAFVFDYNSNRAISAIGKLLQQGIKFHVASSQFRIDEHRFRRGAIVVFNHENEDTDLPSIMKKLVEETGITILGIDRNLVDEGPHFGSDQYLEVVRSRVAVVKGGPIRPSSYGSIWFLFEKVYNVPFTALDFDRLLNTDLREYSVLVFPDGFYSGISKSIEAAFVKKLKRWVLEGGSLVGIKGASAWIADKDMGLTSVRTHAPYIGKSIYMTDGGHPPLPILSFEKNSRKTDKDPDKSQKTEDSAGGAESEAASMEQLTVQSTQMVPGAIFRAKVYPHHYLSYGYEGEIPVLVWSNLSFSAGGTVGVPVYFAEAERVLVAGFASPDSVKKLALTPFLMDEKRGLGHVILYADDPNFRLYWNGLTRLFFNSVFFSNSF